MIWLLGIVIIFAVVVFFGAPYLPTHKAQLELALDLMKLKPGQLMIDLGSGDGRLLKLAAERGWRVVGYELNPLLVIWSWLKLRPRRRQAKVVWADFFRTDWPKDTNGIYIFGSKPVMRRLATKLTGAPSPLTLVSYGFELPGREYETTQGGFFVYRLK